jgi:putative addiction module antidote
MYELTITKVGNSNGVVLPKGMMEEMRVFQGEKLYATPTPEGMKLSKFNPEFAKKMAVMESVLHDYSETLRELSKK